MDVRLWKKFATYLVGIFTTFAVVVSLPKLSDYLFGDPVYAGYVLCGALMCVGAYGMASLRVEDERRKEERIAERLKRDG